MGTVPCLDQSLVEMSNDAGILYDFELPLASIARIIKGKLPPGVTLTKEARQACARAGGIFIMALSGRYVLICVDIAGVS